MKETVALITGGLGHVGREAGRALAAKGVNIVIVDKNTDHADSFVAELEKEYGVKSACINANLLESESFAQIKTKMHQSFGRLDFIVNNAAFYDDAPGWGVPFEEEGYEAWLKVMKVNLLSPFFLTQALAPLLRKSPVASVVNISSIYGVVAPDHNLYEGLNMTNPAAYAASKGGLIQLTKWLATMLAPEIRVNTVTPGGIERSQNRTFLKRYEKKTPLGRMATEKDIAGVITFLCSPEASYITGQNIIVDGGWTVW